jgi:hypothetical protein
MLSGDAGKVLEDTELASDAPQLDCARKEQVGH